MVPSPRRPHAAHAQPRDASPTTRRELDGLVLMGGADVCPRPTARSRSSPEWNGDRIRDDVRDRAAARVRRARQARARHLPRRAAHQRRDGRHAVPGHRDRRCPHALPTATAASTRRTATRLDRAGIVAWRSSTRARRSSRPTRSTTRRSRTSAATSSSRRGRSPTASSRRSAATGPSTWSACSGTLSSIPTGDRSFIDDQPLLDDFLRHRGAPQDRRLRAVGIR